MGVIGDSIQVQKGLEGVVADTTAVSFVDGDGGHLYYRGQPIEVADPAHFRRGPAPGRVRRVAGSPSACRRSRNICGTPADCRRSSPTSLRELARHGEHPMATLQSIAPLLALEPPAVSLGRNPLEEEGLIVAARLPAAISLIHAALEDHPERPYPQLASLRRALPATPARCRAHARASDGLRDDADPAARSQLQRRHVCRARRVLDAGPAVGGVVGGDRRAVRSVARRRRPDGAGDGARSGQPSRPRTRSSRTASRPAAS